MLFCKNRFAVDDEVLLFFFFYFLGLHPRHMEVPKLGGQTGAAPAGLRHSHSNSGSEPGLQTNTTAHGNAGSFHPLSKARDGTCILIVGFVSTELQHELLSYYILGPHFSKQGTQ